MDLVASLTWLSSLTSATLFFSGGRLWGKALSVKAVIEPLLRVDREARARAEQEALDARQACDDASRALDAEKARAEALEQSLAQALERAGMSAAAEAAMRQRAAVISRELERALTERAAAQARLQELRVELGVERTRAELENGALQQELEERRRAEGQLLSLTDVQRKNLELTLRARVVEQREREIERKQAENDELRGEVERLAGKAEQVEELCRKVCDLEALGFARQPTSSVRGPRAERPSEQRLETAIEDRLDELRLHESGCRTAVLSDTSGLLLASSGDTTRDDDLAAAASMTTYTTERLRQLLPLGEPLEIRLIDVNHVVLRARWLRCDDDKLLLSTLGVATAPSDPRADAIGASISDLVSSA